MKMQIDFYSEVELSIHIDISGASLFQSNETNELFLFSCFTLRQLYNLDQHLVAKALAGLLVYENGLNNLLVKKPKLPDGNLLLHSIMHHVSSATKELAIEKALEIQYKLSDELNYKDVFIQTLDNDFLSKVPKLVKKTGVSNKSFEVSLPPLKLNMKGFGVFGTVLGYKMGYYGFHSVIGLFRYLGLKHKEDKDFLENLNRTAKYCGSVHIFKQTPKDQLALASAYIKKWA